MTGKQFATLIVITFIVAMIWLISDIIFNTKASIPVSPKLESLLSPLNPTFNNRVLDEIDQEVIDPNLTQPARTNLATRSAQVTPSPLPSVTPTQLPSPTITPSPSPNLFPSVSPAAQPSATSSGVLNL